jgi:hypothetical protein
VAELAISLEEVDEETYSVIVNDGQVGEFASPVSDRSFTKNLKKVREGIANETVG